MSSQKPIGLCARPVDDPDPDKEGRKKPCGAPKVKRAGFFRCPNCESQFFSDVTPEVMRVMQGRDTTAVEVTPTLLKQEDMAAER